MTPRTRARMVLFDLDHTLYDSDTSLSMAYLDAAAVGGIDEPETHRADFERINDALWRRVETGEVSPNEVRFRRFEELLVHLGRRDRVAATAEAMAEAFVTGLIDHGELLPGAAEALAVASDRPVGLVTNGIGQVQRGRLDRLGLVDAFESVAISGELGVAKPSPAIFDHVFAELADHGVGPGRDVFMVGDNWGSDVAGALAAGLTPVWLNPDRRPAPDGVDRVVVCEIGHLDELADLIG